MNTYRFRVNPFTNGQPLFLSECVSYIGSFPTPASEQHRRMFQYMTELNIYKKLNPARPVVL